ncbi:TetR/AcrR family transcriptional regulator, partial [Saccharomonospora saliphila]|uniref:TetR/AcrR family transcriptional regulator n=1 Tax=Saccharomonospora saliphila TaxID=369829 RepID=UPI000382ED70
MARPRRISDERLLDAAAVVIGRNGPGFTLSQVAERAGVSVGSVSGRFGSKHGLLTALTREGTARAVAAIRAVADAATTPRQAVLDALVTVVGDVTDARTAAHHLGQLGVDIADPELRDLLGAHYAALETELT